jgi:hypothetical protein
MVGDSLSHRQGAANHLGSGSSSATVTGSLELGAVDIVATDTVVKEAAVVVFELKPGVSVAEAEAFSKKRRPSGPGPCPRRTWPA